MQIVVGQRAGRVADDAHVVHTHAHAHVLAHMHGVVVVVGGSLLPLAAVAAGVVVVVVVLLNEHVEVAVDGRGVRVVGLVGHAAAAAAAAAATYGVIVGGVEEGLEVGVLVVGVKWVVVVWWRWGVRRGGGGGAGMGMEAMVGVGMGVVVVAVARSRSR